MTTWLWDLLDLDLWEFAQTSLHGGPGSFYRWDSFHTSSMDAALTSEHAGAIGLDYMRYEQEAGRTLINLSRIGPASQVPPRSLRVSF